MGKRYGQFCPVAMAAEVLCERWVPLVLREVMYGSTRFNEIARGVPLMSRGLLTQRLRELEGSGILEKGAAGYRLTGAGEALRPLIEEMGLWAQHWFKRGLDEQDLDALREGCVRLQGNPALVRALPRWLPLGGEATQSMGIAR